MPLLERVATLIRANLNDLIEKAEDPEKLLKQLLLDMQNQFMQLKTQTAIAIADRHLLEKKRNENSNAQTELMGKAELALAHRDEGLARAALDRALAHQTAAQNFGQQIGDQAQQIAGLRESLANLEAKMTEARTSLDILIARHRRARIALQTGRSIASHANHEEAFERLRARVMEAEALGEGYAAMSEPDVPFRLKNLQQNDKVEELLADLKRKQAEEKDGA